jgi:hypothetical protein
MSIDFANIDVNPSDFLSIENVWDIKNYDKDNGIGRSYKVPPVNIDCKKKAEDRERMELFDKFLKGKAKLPQRRQNLDKEGKLIIPKRPNFYEDQANLNDYGYDKVEEEKIKDRYAQYKRKFIINSDILNKVKIVKEKNKSPLYKNEKDHYINEIENSEKKKNIYYPHMEVKIKKIKDVIEKDNERKNKLSCEFVKEKYQKKGSFSYEI